MPTIFSWTLIAPAEALQQEHCDLLERLYSRDFGLAEISRLRRRSYKSFCRFLVEGLVESARVVASFLPNSTPY